MTTIDNEFVEKNSHNFYCKFCDYNTTKNFNFKKHLLTEKHKNNEVTIISSISSKCSKKYKCLNCVKEFNDRAGLWRHKKKCIKLEEELDKDSILEEKIKEMVKNALPSDLLENALTPINNEFSVTQDFIKEIFKQNQEFQSNICNQITELFKNSNTTNNIVNGNVNNTQNNQFNLQVYLNETCKNAMTIDQFLDYLQPTIEELEDTARLGYVEGITRIIMRGLKDLEEELRPFHCSDLKRETLFVKNPDGEWEKDTEEKNIMLNFVKAVARKNFNNVNEWRKLHPNCRYHDSKSNDMFNQIMLNSTSGRTEKEQQESYQKIIKNIAKETIIDKKANKNKTKTKK
jgi:hypothetical protein